MEFMKVVNYTFNRESLLKFMAHINKNLIDYPLEDEELNTINDFIKNNNILQMSEFVNQSIFRTKEVFKDIIANKTDDLWQFVMNHAYSKWTNNMSRSEFLEQLSAYERTAVIFGNFNYQVENGNFSQWDTNDYSKDCDELVEFLENSDYKDKLEFINLLGCFNDIKNSINKLNRYDDYYDLDVETRYNEMDKLDFNYNRIKESWSEYFRDYLVDNIPKEYMDLMLVFDKDKVGI